LIGWFYGVLRTNSIAVKCCYDISIIWFRFGVEKKVSGMKKERVLVIGSGGQIGGELVEALRAMYGQENVIASDIKDLDKESAKTIAPYETLNVMNAKRLFEVIKQYEITQVYLLAALLSATAEKNPAFAWDLNMNGLFNVLELAREKHIRQLYWPSSIAVFGPSTPRERTPQYTVMEPTTVYGISKQAGERWCEYYFLKHGVDVRSLRYPGLIGYKRLRVAAPPIMLCIFFTKH
jgi:nucleoside-diphosphate-sugar epimerase